MSSVTTHIYFFSGTGNAQQSAHWFARSWQEAGGEAHIHNLKDNEDIRPAPGSFVACFYPTHGFNAPPLIWMKLMQFPRSQGHRLLLANTRAGMKAGKYFLPGLSGVALLLPALNATSLTRLKQWRRYRAPGQRVR